MKVLSGLLDSWSSSLFQCCLPETTFIPKKSQEHSPHGNNTFIIVHSQPSFVPPPSTLSSGHALVSVKEERGATRKRRGSGYTFSPRKRPTSSSHAPISRRPHISPPTNFRHIYSESFQCPNNTLSETKPQRASFHPLELTITSSDTQISPILPQISSPPVTPPPRALTASSPIENYSPAVSHARSHSSMSFHIPRRPVHDGSVFDSLRSNSSPLQQTQLQTTKSDTSSSPPAVEDLVQRVAHAMLERDRLQEKLDDIVERQSAYTSSRPTTAHKQSEMEPVPEIPAMPPNALSFSERLGSDCPEGASAKLPSRMQYQANSSRKIHERTPLPPLPLRLRPPLRKKKSFSMVSSWLFTAGLEHKRQRSHNSLTNAPRPVTVRDGYYQVVRPGRHHRSSLDTNSTVSDWTDEEDEQTIPTSMSPSSAATPRAMARPRRSLPIGWREPIHFEPRDNVSVAF